jgi:hypothetical protein
MFESIQHYVHVQVLPHTAIEQRGVPCSNVNVRLAHSAALQGCMQCMQDCY